MSTSELAFTAQRAQTRVALEQQQRSTPSDLLIAHTLGLMAYWEALQPGSKPHQHELLRIAAANWALVLEDDDYWQQWTVERSSIYRTAVDGKAVQSARQSLRDQLQRTFAQAGPELEDAFRLETKAVSLLLRVSKEHPIRARAPILGPLMAQRLELQQTVGEFVAGLHPPDEEWAQVLRILQQLAEGAEPARGSTAFDARARRQLMACFSQLAYPALYLDLKRPRQALDILTQGACPHCGSFRPSASAPGHLQLPRICADHCPRFANHNPAYNFLPNRAVALWQDAVELAVEAHLLLAEQCLAAAHLDIQATIGHWQDALAMAAVGGDSWHLHSSMADMAIARASALGESGRRDDAILLIEATLSINSDARLKGKLAQLLTNRGVEQGNLAQWDKAVADLRQAYDLNPHTYRTRENLVIALRGYASERYQADDQATASSLLKEAIRVLRTALAGDPANTDLKSRLFECEMELSTVSHMDADWADNPLATLLALLGGLADVQTDTSASSIPETALLTQPERLRQSATQKLALRDFQGAVNDLEEALRLSPADNGVKRDLIDALEKQADDLVLQDEYERARSVAERGLGYAPDHPGLQATLATIRLFQPRAITPDNPAVPVKPQEQKRARGLRGILTRILAGKEESRNEPTVPATDARGRGVLRACLQSTDLKFKESQGDFQVPFSTENVGRLIVHAGMAGDHLTLVAPLQGRITNESMTLHGLLSSTFETDHYKLCRRGSILSLESQMPARHATGAMLENTVHGLAKMVDIPGAVLNNPTAFTRHVAELHAEIAMGYMMSGISLHRGTEQTIERVLNLARSTGTRHLATDRNRVRLAFGSADLKVQVVCKGQSAIAIAYMSDMSPGRSNLRLLQRIAEINAEMIVCKIALDSDDDAAFLYDMPIVEESVFRQMRERVEEYVMRYGFELMMLATL